MKNMTIKNYDKATKLIEDMGYTNKEARNIAINAFALASQFHTTVEEQINKLQND